MFLFLLMYFSNQNSLIFFFILSCRHLITVVDIVVWMKFQLKATWLSMAMYNNESEPLQNLFCGRILSMTLEYGRGKSLRPMAPIFSSSSFFFAFKSKTMMAKTELEATVSLLLLSVCVCVCIHFWLRQNEKPCT